MATTGASVDTTPAVDEPTPLPPIKVLVASDVKGRHAELFAAAAKAHTSKAGPFKALFCVGEFFGPNDEELQPFLQGEGPPLPTYFICADEALRRPTLVDDLNPSEEDGGVNKLAPNLFYLGVSGTATVEGLSVAFLGGKFNAASYASSSGFTSGPRRGAYSEAAVEELLMEAGAYRRDRGIDVLLTSEWGEGFDNLLEPHLRPVHPPSTSLSSHADEEAGAEGEEKTSSGASNKPIVSNQPLSPAVGRLGQELSPRYHFSGGQSIDCVLSPYCNHVHTTRFYGLAPCYLEGKSKGKIRVKAFAISMPPPPPVPKGKTAPSNNEESASSARLVEEAQASRAAATANPYTSTRRLPASKYLTVPSKQAAQGLAGEVAVAAGGGNEGAMAVLKVKLQTAAALVTQTTPREGQVVDDQHTEFGDTGDWRCGYCGNVNRARSKQTVRCNLRYCLAPRWLNPGKKGGALSGAAAQILLLELAEANDAVKELDALEKAAKAPPAGGEENGCGDGQQPPGKKAKTEKRTSLYAQQGGGVANPVTNRYKKGKRPGDPSGPSHNRDKW